MKQLKRLTWLVGMCVATTGMVAPHANADENNLKITGGFFTRGFVDIKPNAVNPYFSPASFHKITGSNAKKLGTFHLHQAELGLSKAFSWEEDTINFVIQSKVDPEGTFSLKRIYVDHDNFRAGLAVSNFCDLDAAPLTFGFGMDAPSSFVYTNTAQIGGTYHLESGVSLGVAAEQALENDAPTPLNNIPAVVVNGKYEYEMGYSRLALLYRSLEHSKNNKYQYQPAGGAHLTTVINAVPDTLTWKVSIVGGMGVGSYIADFIGVPKGESKDVYRKGADLKHLTTVGLNTGLEVCWFPQWRSTFALGMLETKSLNDDKRAKKSYGRGGYGSLNLTYHPTENLMVGIEYLGGARFDLSDNVEDKHRIQAGVGFKL